MATFTQATITVQSAKGSNTATQSGGSLTPSAAGNWMIWMFVSDPSIVWPNTGTPSVADDTNLAYLVASASNGSGTAGISVAIYAQKSTNTSSRSLTLTLGAAVDTKAGWGLGQWSGADIPGTETDMTRVFDTVIDNTNDSTGWAGSPGTDPSGYDGYGGAMAVSAVEGPSGITTTWGTSSNSFTGLTNRTTTAGTSGQGASSNVSGTWSYAGGVANEQTGNFLPTLTYGSGSTFCSLSMRIRSTLSGTQITASDTLSASVTDTNAGLVQTTVFAAKTASDTLTASVTDAGTRAAYGVGLADYRTKLASNRTTEEVVAMVFGDSVGEGVGLSVKSDRWIDKLRVKLRTDYSVAGVLTGTEGYQPTFYGWSFFPNQPVVSGAVNVTDYGLGRRLSTFAHTGDTVTFTTDTCTQFELDYFASNFFTSGFIVQIDGQTTNLLNANDSSFETSVAWTVGGSGGTHATLSQSTTRAKTGTKSMLITWGSDNTFPTAQTAVSGLTIGKKYKAEADVWVPTGSPNVNMAIAGIGLGRNTTVKDAWTKVVYYFTATATTHNPQIWPSTQPTAGNQVWVDEVRVEEIQDWFTAYDPVNQSKSWLSPTLSSGVHTVKVSYWDTNGDNYNTRLQGLRSLNGDLGKGAHVYDSSQSGYKADDHNFGGYQFSQVKYVAPDLAIIYLGYNDAGAHSTATFQTNMQTLINNIRNATPGVPILIVAGYSTRAVEQAAYVTPGWVNYVNVMKTLATTNPAVETLDLSVLMPGVDAAPDLYYDTIHPNASGTTIIANAVANHISQTTQTAYIRASDTLSASVTDTSSTGITVVASDTLSASVSDVTTQLAVTRTASDTLTVALGSPVQTFSDDFNRANAANFGSNWLYHTGGWSIVSNAIVNTGGISYSAAWNSPATSPLKQFSQMTWTATTASSVTQGPAVNMPASFGTTPADMTDFYFMTATGTNHDTLGLRRKTHLSSGSGLIATASFAVVSGDVLRLERDGDNLIGYVNGTERIRASISGTGFVLTNESGANYVGLHGASVSGSTWDNWSGGDLGSANGEVVSTKVFVTASDTLSASVTDNGTFATVAVAASDTLSASMTDTGSISGAGTQVSASDTLSASATESVTIAVNLSVSDSLSASVTDSGTFATVNVTASDTLTASITETANAGIPIVASDTLTVALTDAGVMEVTGSTVSKSASDTMTVTFELEEGILEPSDFVIPTEQTTKTFTFPAVTEGFVATLSANATAIVDSGIGNPLPSLKINKTGKSNPSSQSYWEWTGTWENLGVPSGAIVTKIQLVSAWNRVSQYTNGTGVYVGPYDLRDSTGGLISTLWSGRAASSTDAGTTIIDQPEVSVPFSSGLYSSTVKLRLSNSIGTTNQGNPSVTINDDELSFLITYMPPLVIEDNDYLTAAVTETANIFVSGLAKSASDTLTASVTDTSTPPVIKTFNKTATDTLTASVTDNATKAVTYLSVVASDTLSAATTESSVVVIGISASDTLTAALTETTKRAVDANPFPAYTSDTTYNNPAEYNGGGQLQKSASDTLTAAVTESVAFSTIARTASDTLTASVTESIAFGTIPRGASDTLTADVTEEGQINYVRLFDSDFLGANVTEQTSFATIQVSRSDTLSVSVTEDRDFGTIVLSAGDTLAAMLTEFAGGTRFFSSADTLTAAATEFTQRLVNGNLIITSSDNLWAAVTEATQFGTIPRTASDTLSAAVTDEAAIRASRSASDTLTASVTDTVVKVANAKLASDTLTARLSGEAGVKVATTKYPITVWVPGPVLATLLLWNGTAWYEPEMFLWNGVDWV